MHLTTYSKDVACNFSIRTVTSSPYFEKETL